VAAVHRRWCVGLTVAGAVVLAGCKPAATARVPRSGDLDTYLAALDGNESDLRAAGVVVSKPSPAATRVRAVPADPEPDVTDADLEAVAPMEDAVEAEMAEMDDAPAAAPEPIAASDSMAPRRSSARERRDDGRSRCDRICDLAEMACELEVRICALAQDHEGEARYEGACTRAQDQCATAADACRTCR
jgi:hypothetical protein